MYDDLNKRAKKSKGKGMQMRRRILAMLMAAALVVPGFHVPSYAMEASPVIKGEQLPVKGAGEEGGPRDCPRWPT